MTRPSRPRTAKLKALTGATVVAAGIIAAVPMGAQAAEVAVPCSESALVAAINTANSTAAADTLNLAAGCTYRLTSSHGGVGNGLPVITSTIALVGTPNIITRSAGLFRIAEVSSTGNFTLTRVRLDNGSTLGSGGGVLNRGAVTFTSGDVGDSGLTNNTAGLLGTGGGLSNVDTPNGTAPAATFTGALVSGNTAGGQGGGIYNGNRDTLTMVSSVVTNNRSTLARGGGIAAATSTTSLTSTAVSVNHADTLLVGGAGGVFRLGGTMTTTTSPISANTTNNCVGSSPAVPNCTA
jgi:predicted outer membrane repeat protein